MDCAVYFRQRMRDCVFTRKGMAEGRVEIRHLAVNRLHQVTSRTWNAVVSV